MTSGPSSAPLASRAARVPGWSARTQGRSGWDAARRRPTQASTASGVRFSARWIVANRYPPVVSGRSSPGTAIPASTLWSRTSRLTLAARSCIRSPHWWTPVDDALGGQVVDRRGCRRESPMGQVVADDPIDLLRHAAVERAQAGLDVGTRHCQLGRHQRTCQCRIGIAVDEDRVRPRPRRRSARGGSASPRSAPRASRRRRPGCDPAPEVRVRRRSRRPGPRRSAAPYPRGSRRAANAGPATAPQP